MRRRFLCLCLAAAPGLPAAVPPDQEDAARKAASVEKHYARWLGVPAPELGPQARDRIFGPTVGLKAYRGRRVLLVGLTGASDTVHPPDRKALTATLEAIQKAREK